ncbi:MAG: SPASM domain-containing protein [Promethearchaeota archaeon]
MKCYAAKSSFFLIPNGDVTPCLKINYSFGNIYKNDFDAIWKGRINNKIKEFRGKNKGCQCLTPCDTIPFIIVQYFPVFYFSNI